MASANQTRPHCVNQMGKTHSKPLSARHGCGMGTACYVWIGLKCDIGNADLGFGKEGVPGELCPGCTSRLVWIFSMDSNVECRWQDTHTHKTHTHNTQNTHTHTTHTHKTHTHTHIHPVSAEITCHSISCPVFTIKLSLFQWRCDSASCTEMQSSYICVCVYVCNMMMYVTLLSYFGDWFPCTQPPEPYEMYTSDR